MLCAGSRQQSTTGWSQASARLHVPQLRNLPGNMPSPPCPKPARRWPAAGAGTLAARSPLVSTPASSGGRGDAARGGPQLPRLQSEARCVGRVGLPQANPPSDVGRPGVPGQRQRGAQGWTDWVREIVSFGQYGRSAQSKTAGPKRPAPSRSLKTSLKPANKAKLTRDLQQAPKDESAQEMVQLRRTNPVIKDFKKKPVTAEEKLVRRVDPPRPFDIDEQYLETPKERKDRVERIPKKKALNPFSQPPMSKFRRHL